jgi:hypothetical protein
MSYDAEDLAAAYLSVRDERDRLAKEYENNDKQLKEQQDVIKSALLELCNSVNADSIKTGAGLVMRQLKERFYPSEWDSFRDFIVTHGLVDLLERRVHQKNFKSYMDDHKGEGLPPGVNVMKEFDIVVRRNRSSTSESE